MNKTIFYMKSSEEDADHFFSGAPHSEYLTINKMLYNTGVPNVDIRLKKDGTFRKVMITEVLDYFYDDGIIRKISLSLI